MLFRSTTSHSLDPPKIPSTPSLDKNIPVSFHLNSKIVPCSPCKPNITLPNLIPARYSTKKNAEVEAYSAITHEGLIRKYNEDRVSIILNVMKPYHRQIYKWPKICFFGVYDGHGGTRCADYLRDHLHYFVNH